MSDMEQVKGVRDRWGLGLNGRAHASSDPLREPRNLELWTNFLSLGDKVCIQQNMSLGPDAAHGLPFCNRSCVGSSDWVTRGVICSLAQMILFKSKRQFSGRLRMKLDPPSLT